MIGKVQASEMHGVVRSVRSKSVVSAKLAVAVAMGLAFTYGAVDVHAQDAATASGTGSTVAQPNTASGQPDATAKKKKDAKELATVTVTGIRASVQSAQDLKQNADQIVDSVTAVDINALPDRSVTETLQRISGVTIDHFISPNDPDHPSAEGSGVSIRGLSQVKSLLNGRDSFSSNSGRALSFEDVPAELMAGVDVYKNPNAELIEGGIGGTVNLRTRMPFDSPGQVVGFSTGVNEGDLSKKSKPSASFLYSNRWKTESLGEFGALLDVSYSELATRTDGIQVEPYSMRTDSAATAGSGFNTVYVPGGADWRTLDFQRRRIGIAAALQWRPTNDLEFSTQFIHSRYDMSWLEHGAIFSDTTGSIDPASGTTFNYNDQGVFQSGALTSSAWSNNLSNGGVRFDTDTRYQTQTTTTNDWSTAFKYNLNDHMMLSGDVQFVKSTSNELDFTVFQATYLPGLDLNVNGSGGMPSVTVNPSSYTSNPANYFWSAAMDHRENEVGMERAARLDLEYDFDDSNWLKYFKVGVRATDRTEDNVSTGYNWGVITDSWASVNTPSTVASVSYYPTNATLYSFSNFFRGSVKIPTPLYFPSASLVENYSSAYSYLHPLGVSWGWSPVQITPADLNNQGEKTKAAYGVLYFGNETALGIPFDGNIGVRLVRTDVDTTGVVQDINLSSTGVSAAEKAIWNGGYTPLSARNHYQDALPSLNLRFKLTDDLQWRIAASKAVTRPDFSQMQSFVQLGYTLNSNNTQVVQWNGLAGNPDLKPMRATQFDTALEWYFAPTGLLYGTAFYKDINNYIAQETKPETYNGQVFDITRPYNIGRGLIRGAEVGYNQFFDFLPGWMKGFGVQANATFVSSTGGVNSATTPYTNAVVTGVALPLVGLSKRSYNFTGMYERGPWSARLAWNWRSRYLLTTSDASTHLPTWSGQYGQLDASVFYKINSNVQVGLQANNLTNATTRVWMGPTSYGNGIVDYREYQRSWFTADRRYELVLRATF
ncbi:TonB-dependent receptor [Dyella acidisoli]|uniref:TonB-dependent receptor n=2 Tax=Dyella acidisoli TaxID=1867834 RepID=A0ABQ5XHT3_9GAMM|nr:TonB-dependent receptor [Dyella acidisoli]GLQ91250.1 TonB-dependent receptor [Dyella acidisoli]